MFGLAKFGHDTVRSSKPEYQRRFRENVDLGVFRRGDHFAQGAKRRS